jgi:arabinogalactan endo-1,4-beta-galactosidase
VNQSNVPVSRRRLLAGAAATAAAVTMPLSTRPAQAATTFIKGTDVSWVPQMEANGYYWLDSTGNKGDILAILKTYGITAVRLRTFVAPSDDPVDGHCSAAETAAFAARCRAAGLQVMIDMHFGDTWNSVGKQNPPAAWAALSYSQMRQAMYDYVYHTMSVVKSAHVTPAWVQLGNETNLGICLPTGSVSSQPAQMTGLLNAAYEMVKEVFPSTQTLIHLAQPQKYSAVTAFLDAYVDNGGNWDVTGFSSYASGTSTIDTIVTNYVDCRARYGKPVMQVEFGGRADRADRTYADLVYFIQQDRSNGVQGLFYWEPEQYTPFDTYTMGAWDGATREPTHAMDGFLA